MTSTCLGKLLKEKRNPADEQQRSMVTRAIHESCFQCGKQHHTKECRQRVKDKDGEAMANYYFQHIKKKPQTLHALVPKQLEVKKVLQPARSRMELKLSCPKDGQSRNALLCDTLIDSGNLLDYSIIQRHTAEKLIQEGAEWQKMQPMEMSFDKKVTKLTEKLTVRVELPASPPVSFDIDCAIVEDNGNHPILIISDKDMTKFDLYTWLANKSL